MPKPNYAICSLGELEETLEHMDQEAYPERAGEIAAYIALRKSGVDPSAEVYLCPTCESEVRVQFGEFGWSTTLTVATLPVFQEFALLFLGGPTAGHRQQCSKCENWFKVSELNKSFKQPRAAGTPGGAP